MEISRRNKIIQAKILDVQSQMLLTEVKSDEIQGAVNVSADTDLLALQENKIAFLETLKNRDDDDLLNELTMLFKQWFEKPNQVTRVQIDCICITALGLGMDDYMMTMEAREHASESAIQ